MFSDVDLSVYVKLRFEIDKVVFNLLVDQSDPKILTNITPFTYYRPFPHV